MSHEIQYTKNPIYFAIRYGVWCGVLIGFAFIVYGIIRYPSAFTLSPVETIVYLALCMGLLSGYSWLAWRVTTQAVAVTLRWGGGLGLVLGLCWLIELWAGNLADPSAMVQVAYHGSILAVPVLTFMIALYVARRTGLTQTGVWIGIWSGIISALITFLGLMMIAYSGRLLHDSQTIQQALHSGVTDIMAYGVADSLVAAINHLWIGPLLGIIFGTLGGVIGAARS